MKRLFYVLLSLAVALQGVGMTALAENKPEMLINVEDLKLGADAKTNFTMAFDDQASGGKYYQMANISDLTRNADNIEPDILCDFHAGKGGTYYFWLRYKAETEANDSFFYKINEEPAVAKRFNATGSKWGWQLITSASLQEGYNELKLFRREGGMAWDCIYITPTRNFAIDSLNLFGEEEPAPELAPVNHTAELLKKMNILEQGFSLEQTIQRGQAVKYIVKTVYPEVPMDTAETKTVFRDVSPAHENYSYIKFAKDHGIVKGDSAGNFNPDADIAYSELIVMLINAMGYTPCAEAAGGYHTGYYAAALEHGFLNDMHLNMKDTLSGDTFARALYNLLFVDLLLLDSISDQGASIVKSDGENLLDRQYHMMKTDAVVADDGVTSLLGESEFNRDRIVLKDRKGDLYQTSIGSSDINRYFGSRVEAYIREEDDNYELIYYCLSDKTREITVTGDSISDVQDNYLEYETDNGYKKITYRPESVLVVYNGAFVNDRPFKEIYPKDGFVKLIDNNNDGSYDIIYVQSFNYQGGNYKAPAQNYAAGNISSDRQILSCLFNPQKSICFDDEVCNYRIVSGNLTDIADLKSYQVVSVAESPTELDGKKFYFVYVSDGMIKGKIESLSEDYAVISGEKIGISSSVSAYNPEYIRQFGFNAELSFFIDVTGRIVYAMCAETTGRKYAYVIDIGKTDEGFGEEKGRIQLFNLDAEVVTFEIADKIYLNDSDTKISLDELIRLLKPDFARDTAGVISSSTTDGLIVYRLNALGQIDRIYIPQAPEGDPAVDSRYLTLDKVLTTSSQGARVVGGVDLYSAPIFSIYRDNKTGKFLENGSSVIGFNASIKYNNIRMYDAGIEKVAKAALQISYVQDGDSASAGYLGSYGKAVIFEKSVQAVKPSGDTGRKIYFYEDGVKKEKYISDSALAVDKNSYVTDISDFRPGDVFIYETNGYDEVIRYSLLYSDYSSDGKQGYIFLDTVGGVGTYSRNIQLLKGNLQYKGSLYYTLKMQTDAGEEFYPFTKRASSKVYEVNKSSGKIRVISESELNASGSEASLGDEVLIYGNRDFAEAVILYKEGK